MYKRQMFSRWFMPILLLISLVLLVRILCIGTPDPSYPVRSIEMCIIDRPMPAWPSRPAAVRRMNMTPG